MIKNVLLVAAPSPYGEDESWEPIAVMDNPDWRWAAGVISERVAEAERSGGFLAWWETGRRINERVVARFEFDWESLVVSVDVANHVDADVRAVIEDEVAVFNRSNYDEPR